MAGRERRAAVVRAHARRHRHRVQRLGARRVRRRAPQGRLPGGRVRRGRQAVHPHVRRRRHRRVRADPGLVHGGVRHGRRRARGLRGEDVVLPAAPAGRVPHDLRQHHRTPARPEPAVDLRARDEPLHADVRVGQARHRGGRGQEQAERGRPPGGAARPVRHHRRRRPGERGPGVAGAAARRLADQRRRRRDRDGERGGRAPPDRQAGVGRRRRMEPRHHLLDEPRPRLPGVRGERGAHGLRHGRHHRAAQADPRRRAVRPVRLQGAAPPRRTDAVRQGEGAGGRARRGHRA